MSLPQTTYLNPQLDLNSRQACPIYSPSVHIKLPRFANRRTPVSIFASLVTNQDSVRVNSYNMFHYTTLYCFLLTKSVAGPSATQNRPLQETNLITLSMQRVNQARTFYSFLLPRYFAPSFWVLQWTQRSSRISSMLARKLATCISRI